jgi:tRNA G37 N-methylase TrmD
MIATRVTIGDPTITGGHVAAIRTGSAVLRRILGRRLRKLREQAGHTLESAAPLLEWSTSKLSRIETAQQLVDVHGVHCLPP